MWWMLAWKGKGKPKPGEREILGAVSGKLSKRAAQKEADRIASRYAGYSLALDTVRVTKRQPPEKRLVRKAGVMRKVPVSRFFF